MLPLQNLITLKHMPITIQRQATMGTGSFYTGYLSLSQNSQPLSLEEALQHLFSSLTPVTEQQTLPSLRVCKLLAVNYAPL